VYKARVDLHAKHSPNTAAECSLTCHLDQFAIKLEGLFLRCADNPPRRMWSALFSGARSELDVQDFFMVRVCVRCLGVALNAVVWQLEASVDTSSESATFVKVRESWGKFLWCAYWAFFFLCRADEQPHPSRWRSGALSRDGR
jgi:hypothetical protein